MLETTNLNWSVRPETMVSESGIIIPGKIAMIREDTNTVLGVHSNGYVPYQNIELMELLYKITQSTGLILHSAGTFGDGKKVWIQLKSDDLKLGNDTIKGYLSGINSFDGSTNLAFGNANLTISCMNSFWVGYRKLDAKLRHTSSMKVRIEEILKNMDVLLENEKLIFNQIVRMNEIGITPKLKEMVKIQLFDLKKNYLTPELSKRKQNQIEKFEIDLKTELNDKGETLWGLFSGVTRFTTHTINKDATKNMENKMYGRVGNAERTIFHDISLIQ